MVMVEDSLNVLIKQISNELTLKNNQVQNVIQMLQDGNTVPFIARYRKEMTGSLDEVQIRSIYGEMELPREPWSEKSGSHPIHQ